MIRLLVDSASDYTQEEIRNKNLYFVPLQIQIEGKNYLDGVDIDKETFYDGSLTLTHSQNSQMSFMYGFFFVKFLIFAVVCVVIMI